MKKLIFSMAMVALLVGAVSCNKDKEKEDQSNSKEGIYAPEMKIASILDEGDVDETWNWGSSKLASIDGRGVTTTFDYNGNRMSVITLSEGGQSQQLKYTYEEGWMTKLSIISDNKNLLVADIRHNANDQISGMNATLNADYLMELFGSLMSGAKRPTPKFQLTNQDIQMEYVWEGENVKQMIVSANITSTINVNDITSIIDEETLESILGDYAGFLPMLTGDFPLVLSIKDTLSYTYDSKKNPYYMMLSEGPMAKSLSINNPLTEHNSGVVDFNLSVTIPILNIELPLSQSVPISFDNSWAYNYNEKGFPTCIIESEGAAKDIRYIE